jgi:hypothetical protein
MNAGKKCAPKFGYKALWEDTGAQDIQIKPNMHMNLLRIHIMK